MSVYRDKRRRTYQYDFWYAGRRHKGNTFQENEADARLVEAKKKLRLRRERGGIAEPGPSPLIASWAGAYFTHLEKLQKRTGRPKRLDRIDENLRVVLRFFGAKPTAADDPLHPQEDEEAPFHDLTLQDLVDEPTWITEFEDWVDRRHVAGSTRNHYYSTMSQLYRVAMLPAYRKATGVRMNPFAGIPRSRKIARKVTLTPAVIATWLAAMSYHVRLAVSIAALAPKLRLRNILLLDRYEHLDPDITRITIYAHKSDVITNEPLIVPVSQQLRVILLHAFGEMRTDTRRVVQYRGQPVASVRGGLAASAREAGIPYGRFTPGGVTFHTLRHSAATLFARLGVTPWLQRDALGHKDLETTEGYTHLELEEQRIAYEQLSAALPIAEIVMTAPRRARRTAAAQQGDKQGSDTIGARENPQDRARVTRGALATPGRPFRRNPSGNLPK